MIPTVRRATPPKALLPVNVIPANSWADLIEEVDILLPSTRESPSSEVDLKGSTAALGAVGAADPLIAAGGRLWWIPNGAQRGLGWLHGLRDRGQ